MNVIAAVALSAALHAPIGPGAGDDAAQRRLIEAIRMGDAAGAKAALEAGADANGPGGRAAPSAASLALLYGDGGVVGALHDAGADLAAVRYADWNALELALCSTSADAALIKRLMESGLRARTSTVGAPALASPCARENPEVMRALLDAGYNPSERVGGYTPLAYAVLWGVPESVKALLDAGAKPGQSLGGGRVAMHLVPARRAQHAEVVRLLKDAGGDVNADDGAWTPLLMAVYCRSADAVRALADAGADVNAQRNGESIPLVMAAQIGGAGVVRALLEKGARPDTRDDRGQTALLWALRGAEPSSRWEWRETMPWASGETFREMFAIIERLDADGMIEALLKAGADPNAVSGEDGDWSPLTLATYLWAPRSLRGLAENDDDEGGDEEAGGPARGVSMHDPWVRDFYEEHDPTHIVRLLVEAGAKRRVGGDEPDALDVASRRRDERSDELVRILRGAKVERLGPEPLQEEGGQRGNRAREAPPAPRF